MNKVASQLNEFRSTLRKNSADYQIQLTENTIERLCKYYELLLLWNPRVHLVAPCSPHEFATRHVLESLVLLAHLSSDARVADVGSGAGLPIIPCLIARPDLSATLIESSQKKAIFLREALKEVELWGAGTVVARPFEETATVDADYITCRALDRFLPKLPSLIGWSPEKAALLLFGGESLRDYLGRAGFKYDEILVPRSQKRFLFIVRRDSKSR